MANTTNFSLASYVRVGRYNLPEPTRTTPPANSLLAQEASAVTFNQDTGTLFVLGDGGTSIVQVSLTGQLIDSMTLAPGSSPQGTDFFDPEGLTYVGGGKFVMVEERDRQAVQFTYAPGTTLTRAGANTVKLGTTIGNIGLEGVTFDPQTGGYIFVKEKQPEGIFQTNIDFTALTATNGSPTTDNSTNLFDPTLANLLDIADVFALSNVAALDGTTASSHLLMLSQESGKIEEVDRSGNVISTLTIVTDPGNPLSVVDQQHEGVTMDDAGNLYVVSENGGGDFDHPQLWVYAPSTALNQAPTAVVLNNNVLTLLENSNTATRLKVANVAVTDDGQGNNTLAVTGADAANFEVDSTGLYIKAGTTLDFETKNSYAVTVTVDDTSIGATPDASVGYTLSLIDVVNETAAPGSIAITETAPWSSGNSPVAADWFEVTNFGASAIDITGWKMDDNSFSFGSAVALSGITSIAAGESVIFLETATLAATKANFLSTWFGANAPAGLQVGAYSGSGVGLSTGGDGVVLFDGTGVEKARVSFGASGVGTFKTFSNAAGANALTLTATSEVRSNGAFVAAGDTAEIGSPGTVGRLFVSEVAPWSSGNSPVAADWFEVTNGTAFAIDITGWKMDDNSGSPAAAVALNGITSIAPGESVIFLETATLAAAKATFLSTWFGSNPPANLQVGNYSGAGVGLGTGGDAVNLYDATNILRASVTFGASPTGTFATFENGAAQNGTTISALSVSGANGAAVARNDAAEIGSPGAIVNAAPCFAAGTRLATLDGLVAVEALAVGQRVRTMSGGERVVKWIGHREVACGRHKRPHDVWPVRVAPHAFGAGMPATTLWLSPDHAVFIDGLLIPVRYLINDATITQVPRELITYWHVELDTHDLMLAEGLPCESYLDTGNRGAFANGGGAAQLHPDFAPVDVARAIWATEACAELAMDGAELEAARSYLLERAGILGHVMTQDAAFRVLAGGLTLPAAKNTSRHRFVLSGNGLAFLTSRSAVPAHMCDLDEDHRRLGVAVARIWLDGVAVALDDARLGSGWHAVEGPELRWTDGHAEIDVGAARLLEVELAMKARYWDDAPWCAEAAA